MTRLSPDDDAWLSEEPSAALDVSWIEDDLQSTPADERFAAEVVDRSAVPASPEVAFTPPPKRRPTLSIPRPVVERVRSREGGRQGGEAPRAVGGEAPRAVGGEAPRAAAGEPAPDTREVPVSAVPTVTPPLRVPAVSVEVVPSRTRVALLYAGAVAVGLLSGAAVLLLGR